MSRLVVRYSLLVLILPIATASVPAETVPTGDAPIVEVTVYRDRAEVIRQATVQLPAGASTVEFDGIPMGAESDSLRVSAEGVPATLGAVELRQKAEEPKDTEELRVAREEVRRLEREIAALGEDDAVDRELLKFLKSLGNVTASKQAKEMAEGRADPEGALGIYDLMESKMRALGAVKLERREHRRKLKEELELAKAHLATLRPAGSILSRTAEVEIETERAGSLTLRLAYLQRGASWRPAYRAVLDASTGEVTLIAEGVVRQSSGEDWSDVDLRLSSASPQKGVEPPMLLSWVLRPYVPQGGYARIEEKDAVPGRFYQNVLEMAPGVQDEEDYAPEPAVVEETEIVKSAYNVSFKVPGGSDIPADGSDHRVVLRQETLGSNLIHRTVPGVEPRAYLTAVTTSPADYPLLGGPVRVFTGGAYLGSYPLDETGPGIELRIPFGADNRIEVIRVPEPEKKSTEGIIGKQRQVRKTERTIVQNLTDREVTLVVEDRLPVSADERIEVTLGKATTPGFKDSKRRPGVMRWELALAPKEKREVVLEYTVRFPRGMNLPGLD